MHDGQVRVHYPSYSRGTLSIEIIDNHLAKHQPRRSIEDKEQERPIDSHGLCDVVTDAPAFSVSVSLINKVRHLTRSGRE